MKKTKRMIAILIVVCATISISMLGKTSIDQPDSIPESAEQPDLSPKYVLLPYMIDGSTATIPLSEAILKARFGTSEGLVQHTTHEAYLNLIGLTKNIIFVTYPSEEEFALARERDIKFEIVPVVKDALVFLTNTENPVHNLTQADIQAIYSGERTNWDNGEPITAFQRPENSGSQTLFLKLAMKGVPPADPETELRITGMGNLVDAVADYDNAENTIGYSVFYYASDMYANSHVKLLSIDGVAPTRETIADGSYPYITYYYAVIRSSAIPDGSERELIDWLLSKEGQMVAQAAGYVPMSPLPEAETDVEPYYGATPENTTQSLGTGGTVNKYTEYDASCFVRDSDGATAVELPDNPALEKTINDWIADIYAIDDSTYIRGWYSSGIISIVTRLRGETKTITFDRKSGKQLQLSDLFLDGFNYIDYINTRLNMDLNVNLGTYYYDERGQYIQNVLKRPYTGIPNDYPHFSYRGDVVDVFFPHDNPFFDSTASFTVPLTSDVSPYTELWQTKNSKEKLSDMLSVEVLTVKTWYDDSEEIDKRTNAALRKCFDDALPYILSSKWATEELDYHRIWEYAYDKQDNFITISYRDSPFPWTEDAHTISEVSVDITTGEIVDTLEIPRPFFP
ncbi:MAG: substrate-binding domain-containing protein [Clostridiales Family XIII bacterium]|jgi:phosphate transport system substrate-binding protein|nr:substrate-binding domain-containing protein [Clostridiales Family XIII bacterium]